MFGDFASRVADSNAVTTVLVSAVDTVSGAGCLYVAVYCVLGVWSVRCAHGGDGHSRGF